ncbi:MAG: hypothetical protein KQH63_09785 [Desulfobulbaceae bacterium]|nr:hypothetical protein [Desulfobulbaceae bacterium]
MKIAKVLIATMCIFGLTSAGQVLAGKGPGQGKPERNSDSTLTQTASPSTHLVSCDELGIVSGQVASFVTGSGNGMELDLGAGQIISIYGIGSLTYWESLGVDQPCIGETVEVEYATITFSDDSTKDVAVSITFVDSGETVELREADTCIPFWRGSGRTNQ